MLEAKGYKQISSYTTRSPRFEGEQGHIFISEEEYKQLNNIVASTEYNGYHYCTTLEQIQNADIYVVDVPGVATLLDNYNKINRNIYVIYFEANTYNRILRMIERHDSDTSIVSRLLNDEKNDWVQQLFQLNTTKFRFQFIDTNNNLNEVYKSVKEYIEEVELND